MTATAAGRTGTARTITAGYLVGADGAHSQVRSELALAFRGHPYPEDWLLADVRLDWDRPDDEVHAFFRRDGRPLICMPMRDQLWRVIIPCAGGRGQQAPTLEEIRHLVAQRAPAPAPQVSGPTWLATFRCHRRSAGCYRRGRVLLAGDAVHTHSPAGGQGMNTGIMDAHNLAWKLALVASGHAPGRLLDSYGQERGPAAADVLALTHALVTLGTMTHPVQRALRRTVIPLAAPGSRGVHQQQPGAGERSRDGTYLPVTVCERASGFLPVMRVGVQITPFGTPRTAAARRLDTARSAAMCAVLSAKTDYASSQRPGLHRGTRRAGDHVRFWMLSVLIPG